MRSSGFVNHVLLRVRFFFPSCLLFFSMITNSFASTVDVEKLLEAENSWDGKSYKRYPLGKPQLTILKISVAPNSYLDWHQHPIPHAAYVLNGNITVQKKDGGALHTVHAGETIAEVVDTLHRGYTDNEGVTLIVFYAGERNVPLSIPYNND
ncbi:quercetin dioxygenase-like cupin family protein [Pantoea agglomerans]|uniref:cupin domain-containing protein n=2 Tax=Enterobacter agglomerans TaxID=549 RepID=UPI001F5C01F9|nr:cupin domain-containing protein [Pantoea agglomerans]MDQ0430946.1 quercetin dioxygenase-like cupin family protein [Pantoea agglomerans]